jgi:hypothetical protein
MKIFQPTISSSAFIAGLTTASQASVLTYDATTGQVFYTASSAIGGGGGSGTPGGNPTEIQYNNGGSFGGVDKLTFDGTNLIGTGSFTGSFTGQFNGSITTAGTASFATNFTVTNTLIIDATLTDYFLKASTSGGPNPMFAQATGSYTSAFGKYTTYNGVNSRAGEFVTSWNGTATSYYDNATVDIGNTADIIFESVINGEFIEIKTGINTPSGWTIKMLITYI